MHIELIDFQIMGDERGSLIALEEHYNAPFDIKRVYYIFDTKDDGTYYSENFTDVQELAEITNDVMEDALVEVFSARERYEMKHPRSLTPTEADPPAPQANRNIGLKTVPCQQSTQTPTGWQA